MTAAVDDPTTKAASPWDRFLFAPESTSAAALLRVGWGFLAAVWALTLLPDIDPLLTDGALRYGGSLPPGSWNPLDWTSWDGAPLAACVVLVVAGITTMVGYRTRLSSVVAVLCMLSLQRTNATIFNSGDLLLRQIGLIVALAPTGLVLSLDARRTRHGGAAPPARAPWALRLLQLEIALGYALSCWAKLRGSTWHEGTALGLAMRIEDLQRFAAPEWLYDQEILLNLLTWGTLLFEGAFLFVVWSRRLRPWVLWAGVAFHLAIDVIFDVGFFSAAMWLAYLAFLPPETADGVVARIQARLGRDRGEETGDPSATAVPLPIEPTE